MKKQKQSEAEKWGHGRFLCIKKYFDRWEVEFQDGDVVNVITLTGPDAEQRARELKANSHF